MAKQNPIPKNLTGIDHEIEIRDLDDNYEIQDVTDLELPPTYKGKAVTWKYQFNIKVKQGKNKPQNENDRKYRLALVHPAPGKKYVLWQEGGSMAYINPNTPFELNAGDPAVGISN